MLGRDLPKLLREHLNLNVVVPRTREANVSAPADEGQVVDDVKQVRGDQINVDLERSPVLNRG